MGELRRLGDILTPALTRLATSDHAKAYGAWARAAGDQVASGARPKAFSRGVLTVECSSAVWANELTYLGPQILRRMAELEPGHPVTRLRFVIGTGPEEHPSDQPGAAALGRRAEVPSPPDLGEARSQVPGVRDERLRAAIEAALGGPAAGPRGSP